MAAGVIGGTASRMGGGSFANGAQTSAFQYLFNEVSKFDKVAHSIGKGLSRIEKWFSRTNFNNYADMGMVSTSCATIQCSMSGAAIRQDSAIADNYHDAELASALRTSAFIASIPATAGSGLATVYITGTALSEDVLLIGNPANTGLAWASYKGGSFAAAHFNNPKSGKIAGGAVGTIIGFLPIVTGD